MQRNGSEDLSIFGDYSQLVQLTDGKLCSEDGSTFNIHKIVLVMNSVYFESLICGLNRDKAEFTVPEVSGRCLAEILRYIYTGQIFVTDENLVDILLAADYLMIPDIHREIKGRFKKYLTISNCLKVFQAANQIPCEDIAHESFRVIKRKWNEIIRTQKNVMYELPFETMQMILSCRSLGVYDESTVWESIVEWTQKDPLKRLCHVPQFLACLPYKELDENLSINILQHQIVSQNSFLKELQELKSSGQFASNFDILSQFLESRSNYFKDSDGYRVPSYLHVIAPRDSENLEITKLFVTYDENVDVWRKIADVGFRPHLLEVMGSHVYLFAWSGTFMKFDLISKQRVQMQNFTFNVITSVSHIDTCLYVIGKVDNNFTTDVFEVYDTLCDSWFEMRSMLDIRGARIVTLGKYIYMLGFNFNYDGIIFLMFDYVNMEWSQLPEPLTDMTIFELVAYDKKIYVFGQSNISEDVTKMHVFEPENYSWGDAIILPHNYWEVGVLVLNSLIVYDSSAFASSIKSVHWNKSQEKWEELEPNLALIDFRNYSFTTIDDVNTVRIITKETRIRETELEESSFN